MFYYEIEKRERVWREKLEKLAQLVFLSSKAVYNPTLAEGIERERERAEALSHPHPPTLLEGDRG